MIEFKARTKKWGNSIGIIIPKSAGIKDDEEVIIHIQPAKKFTTVADIFGTMKFKKPVDQIMREIDEDLEPE